MSDIATIKALVGNSEISDDIVAFYLDSVTNFVLGYCNISSIPAELKPTLLEIAALRVRANSNGGKAAIGEGIKSVGSISDGNQSIGYQVGGTFKQFVSNDDILAAYGSTLDRYRRMVIDSPVSRVAGTRKV
jgi:hypothetical protein